MVVVIPDIPGAAVADRVRARAGALRLRAPLWRRRSTPSRLGFRRVSGRGCGGDDAVPAEPLAREAVSTQVDGAVRLVGAVRPGRPRPAKPHPAVPRRRTADARRVARGPGGRLGGRHPGRATGADGAPRRAPTRWRCRWSASTPRLERPSPPGCARASSRRSCAGARRRPSISAEASIHLGGTQVCDQCPAAGRLRAPGRRVRRLRVAARILHGASPGSAP